MSMSTYCKTVNGNKVKNYRNSNPINDQIKMTNSNVTLEPDKKSIHRCPVKNITDKTITHSKVTQVLNSSDQVINKCCKLTIPLITSDDCSLPLEHCTELLQKTKIPSAVDKNTIYRYSPSEWRLQNETLSNDANEAIRNAKNIMFNSRLIDGQVYLPIDIKQTDNNNRIKDRAQIMFHWKLQLEKCNDDIKDEIEKIQKLMQQFMRCNHTVELILDINRDMERIRNMRLPPDLVHDSLTDEIIKENALCSEIINLNLRYIDDVKRQFKELRDCKQRLENDWSDKKSAYDIDTVCLNIKNSSSTTQWEPGCVRLSDEQSTPLSHEYFIKESLIFIHAALARSRILRDNANNIIQKSAKDLRRQANYIEITLIEQINETFHVYKKLDRTLKNCLKSLADIEMMSGKISGAVRKLDGPMKCAQTRLNIRMERDRVENCRDIPQFGLIDEVKNISEGVSALLSQTNGADKSIDALNKYRLKIESEIGVKKKTLWIDNERCKLLRSYYPTDQALYGYE